MRKITLKELKTRLTDKVTLGIIASAIFGLLLNLGVVDAKAVVKYTDTFNYVIGLLVVIGVVRDPKKPE